MSDQLTLDEAREVIQAVIQDREAKAIARLRNLSADATTNNRLSDTRELRKVTAAVADIIRLQKAVDTLTAVHPWYEF